MWRNGKKLLPHDPLVYRPESRKPTFERWAYWDKFDFWGAIADVIIIGSTGLILWFPNLFCLFLPGVTLNIAKVIHSTQAVF